MPVVFVWVTSSSNGKFTGIATATTLGSINAAGEVTLSETYKNFYFIMIVVNSDAKYSVPAFIPTDVFKNWTQNSNQAIVQVVISSSTLSTCRIYPVNDTKVMVRDACTVYGVGRKS